MTSTLTAIVAAMTTMRRSEPAISHSMQARAQRRTAPPVPTVLFISGSTRALAVGTAVMAMSIEARIEAEIAIAMSE